MEERIGNGVMGSAMESGSVDDSGTVDDSGSVVECGSVEERVSVEDGGIVMEAGIAGVMVHGLESGNDVKLVGRNATDSSTRCGGVAEFEGTT